MPVNIYRVTPEDQKNDQIAWLCDDVWMLRPQVEALSKWLEDQRALPPGKYVADVGFCWRRDAVVEAQFWSQTHCGACLTSA